MAKNTFVAEVTFQNSEFKILLKIKVHNIRKIDWILIGKMLSKMKMSTFEL